MKKLFILLATVMAFISCEKRDVAGDKNIIEKYSKSAPSYLNQSFESVDAQLTRDGWAQNYSGKSYTGNTYVLYIYNRLNGIEWKPIYNDKYAYETQRTDIEALQEMLETGKLYGEILIYRADGIVEGFDVFWLFSTKRYEALDEYKTFSNNLHNTFVNKCGKNAYWTGTIFTYDADRYHEYSNYDSFIEDFTNKYPDKDVREYAGKKTNEFHYSIESRFDYYLSNSFCLMYSSKN